MIGGLLVPFLIFDFFPHPFVYFKWAMVHLIANFSLFYVLKSKEIFIIRDRRFWWFLSLLGLAYLTLYFVHWHLHLAKSNLEILSFLLILMASFQIFSKENFLELMKKYAPFLILLTFAYHIWSFFDFGEEVSFRQTILGQQNLTSQLLGFLLISLIVIAHEKTKEFKILLFSAIIYMVYLGSRSSLLALSLSSCLYFIWTKKYKMLIIPAIILSSVLIYLSQSRIADTKQSNILLRMNRQLNSMRLWNDHRLFGVGPGNFAYSYLGYQEGKNESERDFEITENTLASSPHNAFLELLVEYGLIFGIILLSFLLYILYLLFKKKVTEHSNEKQYFVICSSYWLCESFFSFPMEMPTSNYFLAIFTGAALAFIYKERVDLKTLDKAKRGIFISFYLTHSLFFLFFLISSFSQTIFGGDYRMLKFSCDFFPAETEVCLMKAEYELKEADNTQSIKTLNEVLASQPNNIHALKMLFMNYLLTDDQEHGCVVLTKYHELMGQADKLSKRFGRFCQQQIAP